jgi:hypothetical protein
LLPIGHSSCVQCPTNNVVTNARQILNTAPTNQDDGVFLQIVADTRDVCCYFDPVGQTHTCNFAKGRIRLLWRLRVYARTHASFLRSLLQSRATRLVPGLISTLSNQLIERWHETINSCALSKPSLPGPSHQGKPNDITENTGCSPTRKFFLERNPSW